MPFQIYLPVALGVLVGGIAGAKLLPNISAKWVTLIFAALMFAAGVKMVL